MPANPATTPRLGLPRYDNNVDPADFATQMNAVSDRLDLIAAMMVEAVPIGGQVPYGGIGDPAGGYWLLCDGRQLLIADYGPLHAVIGFRYSPGGNDPGGGLFNLPDKRGRTSVGADTMGTARGSAGVLTTAKGHQNVMGRRDGFERHQLIIAELATHNHAASQGSHAHSLPDVSGWTETPGSAQPGTRAQGTPGTYYLGEIDLGASTGGAQPGISVDNTGQNQEHNNMSPYEVDNWIIRIR